MGISLINRAAFILLTGILASCIHNSSPSVEKTHFTKLDSVTDTYLVIQDSLLHTWKLLIMNESQKIESMGAVLNRIKPASENKNQINALDSRLKQLRNIKITQKSLSNLYVVEEYDFASNSLVSEVLALTESLPNFVIDKDLQELVDKIKNCDTRVMLLRSEYDSIAESFNKFIDLHKGMIKDIDHQSALEKRHLFHVASDSK